MYKETGVPKDRQTDRPTAYAGESFVQVDGVRFRLNRVELPQNDRQIVRDSNDSGLESKHLNLLTTLDANELYSLAHSLAFTVLRTLSV